MDKGCKFNGVKILKLISMLRGMRLVQIAEIFSIACGQQSPTLFTRLVKTAEHYMYHCAPMPSESIVFLLCSNHAKYSGSPQINLMTHQSRSVVTYEFSSNSSLLYYLRLSCIFVFRRLFFYHYFWFIDFFSNTS